MKAVPKVNTDGLYLEDALVDDAFTGVVPFYSDPPEPEPMELDDKITDESEEVEPELAGYIVGVPVPPGLFRPYFDLTAWGASEDDGFYPATTYWKEGLSPEEIEELTRPQPQEPTPTDLLGAELTAMKLQNIEQQAMVSALGSELATAKLEIILLKGADQE